MGMPLMKFLEPYVSSNEPEIDENESANCDSVKAESESNMELDVSRSYSDNGHPDSD